MLLLTVKETITYVKSTDIYGQAEVATRTDTNSYVSRLSLPEAIDKLCELKPLFKSQRVSTLTIDMMLLSVNQIEELSTKHLDKMNLMVLEDLI